MARLSNLKPRLAALAPRIGFAPGDRQAEASYRKTTQPSQEWYTSRRWRQLRWSVLVRDLFTCAICHHVIADTSQLVCDHVEPHRGDERRFWAGPFQTLCKPCHDSAKQAAEQAMRNNPTP
jgi:5-methylcytosine-specific restriction endonuclease McrA